MEEGITFVLKAYDYRGQELARTEFYAEDEQDIFENDEATTEFMVSELKNYREKDL